MLWNNLKWHPDHKQIIRTRRKSYRDRSYNKICWSRPNVSSWPLLPKIKRGQIVRSSMQSALPYIFGLFLEYHNVKLTNNEPYTRVSDITEKRLFNKQSWTTNSLLRPQYADVHDLTLLKGLSFLDNPFHNYLYHKKKKKGNHK